MLGRKRNLTSSVVHSGALRRITGAHGVVVLAAVVAAGCTLAALRSADHTVTVQVFTRPLAAGERVRPADVTTTRIHADADILAGLAPLDRAVGSFVQSRVRVGDLVRSSDLTSGRRASVRTMSFAVSAADGNDGALEPGDRIDVLGAARDGGAVGYVLVDASLRSVSRSSNDGALRSADGGLTLTVVVDGPGAMRLVAAQRAGHLVVVRSTDAAPIVDAPMLAVGVPDVTSGGVAP